MKEPKDFDLVNVQRTKREIQNFRELQYSWEEIGQHYNLSAMIVWKIYERGYVPERNDIRTKLGWQPIDYAPACPLCGLAHTHAHNEQVFDPATQVVKPIRKPRARPARVAIRKDDMRSAAKTIINNLSPDEITELVTQLWFRLQEKA